MFETPTPTPPLEGKISELVLDARWRAGSLRMNDSDHPFLELEHPRYGRLAFLLSVQDAQALSGAFAALLAPSTPAN